MRALLHWYVFWQKGGKTKERAILSRNETLLSSLLFFFFPQIISTTLVAESYPRCRFLVAFHSPRARRTGYFNIPEYTLNNLFIITITFFLCHTYRPPFSRRATLGIDFSLLSTRGRRDTRHIELALISADTLTLLSIVCYRVYATRWQPIRRMHVKRVIPANTVESAFPPTVDPSVSAGPAIMRAPIVRKVGCFTPGSFVVYDRCCFAQKLLFLKADRQVASVHIAFRSWSSLIELWRPIPIVYEAIYETYW